MTQANVYKQIKALRENANYTQYYIAERLGVDNATYSRIERGKIDISVFRFIELAAIFYVSPGSLLADPAPPETAAMEVTVQIKLSNDQKKQILQLLFENQLLRKM